MIANVSQPFTLERAVLAGLAGKLLTTKPELILYGLDIVLGR